MCIIIAREDSVANPELIVVHAQCKDRILLRRVKKRGGREFRVVWYYGILATTTRRQLHIFCDSESELIP